MTEPRRAYRMKLPLILLLSASAITAAANVTLPDVISDAMVLQRDRAVPIWGKADPGESDNGEVWQPGQNRRRRQGRKMDHSAQSHARQRHASDDGRRRSKPDRIERHSGGRSLAGCGPVEHADGF